LRFGAEAKPHKKIAVATSFHSWWLANAHDGLYNAAGAQIARVVDGSAGARVGDELDAQATYTITKQLQAGAGVGHIFPGAFLKKATAGNPYTFPYLMFTYTF